jgi:hypothetical protein
MPGVANPDSYVVLKLRLQEYDDVRPLLIGVQTAFFAGSTAWVDAFLAALQSPQEAPTAVIAIAKAEQEREIAHKYAFGTWLYLGEAERALDVALRLTHDKPSLNVEFLFSREAQALRSHPRFGELLTEIGLVSYWERFGYPEMCHKGGANVICH